MYSIAASIVAYKNEIEVLQKAMGSFLDTDLNVKLYVIDNSPSDILKNICKDNRVCYIYNNRNIGFGAGHNIAICRSIGESTYHLILNPDAAFKKGTLEKLYNFMETEKDIGIAMPKVCNSDDSLQYLCKILPSPLDFILRRSKSRILRGVFKNRLQDYELRFTGYDKIIDVPYLSGCFMFIRTEAFRKAGVFDERFFLHFEDLDLTRRIHRYYRTVYYPEAVIYHREKCRGREGLRILGYLFSSYIKYFNKWGWFFDGERNKVNKKILDNLKDFKNNNTRCSLL